MAVRDISRPIQGVIPILPVPFSDTGALDETSFRRVVEAAVGDGVDAVALFGLASEYAKLADEEKKYLVEVLVDQVAGRVPTIVSITHHSREIAVRQAAEAERLGAKALMILPPFFLSPGADAVEEHIRAIASAVDLPVIVQYAPGQTGAGLTVDRLSAICSTQSNLEHVKVDLIPSGPMIAQLTSRGMKAIVGYMGLFLPQDVERGAVAVMPTVSVSRLFKRLWKLLQEDPEQGRQFHHRMLPLLSFMMQSVEMLVAVEKVMLLRRGVIATDYCRAPHWRLDEADRKEIDRLCHENSDWIVNDAPVTSVSA